MPLLTQAAQGPPCPAAAPAQCCSASMHSPHPTPRGRGGCCFKSLSGATSQKLRRSYIRDNPSISSMAGTGDGHFVPVLTEQVLLLLILIGVKHKQHPHQDATSGRKQGSSRDTEISSFHLKGSTPPSIHDTAPAKKKSWKEAWGWLCPEAAAVSCGSNASCPTAHTFKEPLACTQAHKTINECLTSHCVCSDTAPVAKKKVCMCGCLYIQKL